MRLTIDRFFDTSCAVIVEKKIRSRWSISGRQLDSSISSKLDTVYNGLWRYIPDSAITYGEDSYGAVAINYESNVIVEEQQLLKRFLEFPLKCKDFEITTSTAKSAKSRRK